MIIKLTIPGPPVVLKNRKVAFIVKGVARITNSTQAKKALRWATDVLWAHWTPRLPITGPVNLAITSYGPWKRSSENIPDASNLLQLPEDALQAAGVLADDRQVESHDGSRRVCMCDTCDDRPLYEAGPKRGQWKPDCGAVKKCPYPRVEIVIEEIDDA
jgi:Holliday junction resolvase RusA-like endonuclease